MRRGWTRRGHHVGHVVGVGVLDGDQRGARVALGLHGGQSRARIFIGLQELLGPFDGRLSGEQVGRVGESGAGRLGRNNGLAGVAHLLNRSRGTTKQAGDAEEYRNDAQHKDNGH